MRFGSRAPDALYEAKVAEQRLREEAAAAWAKFDEACKAADAAGKGDDTVELKKLDDLHKTYSEIATRAGKAQDHYVSLLERGAGGPVPREHSIGAMILDAMGGVKAFESGGAGTLIPSFLDELARTLPQAVPMITRLMPIVPTDGPGVTWLRQTIATQAAAPVAVGSAKPASTYTLEAVDSRLIVVATVSDPIDRHILLDWASATTFLQTQMALGVALAIEQQVLSGDGTPPDLTGILETALIGTVTRDTGESFSDAIYRGFTPIRLAHMEPSAAVVHPSDWERLRLEKDADGNLIIGPIAAGDARLETLFGVPAIVTPAIDEGTVLVGDFSHATLFTGPTATFAISETATADSFAKNQVVARSEVRVQLAVERPAAFTSVDLALG